MIWYFMMLSAGLLTDVFLQKYLSTKKRPVTTLFSLLFCLLLTAAFDDPIRIFKGCVFIQALIAVSYLDIKTRLIPNLLLLPIASCGLIGMNPAASVLGATLIPLIMLFFACTSGGIGGGDIKLTAACGLVLGFWNLIPAVIIAFGLSTLSYLIFRWDKNTGCPMAPYIGFGCFIIYLFQ